MQSYGKFAALYDRLMRDVDRDAWAEYIISLLGSTPRMVADCACGTGEITLRLARAGYCVTGVDLSEEMLAVAAEKARKMRLKVPFICQDMRRLALHRQVDAVVDVTTVEAVVADAIKELTIDNFSKGEYIWKHIQTDLFRRVARSRNRRRNRRMPCRYRTRYGIYPK